MSWENKSKRVLERVKGNIGNGENWYENERASENWKGMEILGNIF